MCEFLSDAPFFGLSLWTESKLANCACASGWGCLMNLDLSLFGCLQLVPAGKILGHRKLEVHTVYQRLQATPKDISGYCACLYHIPGVWLNFLNSSEVHTTSYL